MREWTIAQNDAGQRLDKFLTKALPDLPRSLLYKAIRTKKIKRNGKRTEPNAVLACGDVLRMYLAEEFFPDAEEDAVLVHILERCKPDFGVLYEDENILLVHKRAGISVHEDETNRHNNLITQIWAYLYQKGEYDPRAEQSFAPALCNRIDRNTEGIVIAAKNAEALRVMNAKIKARELDKRYLTVVHGKPDPPKATLSGYLLKNEKTKQVTVYAKDPPRGAKAIRTAYRVLEYKNGLALLEVELLTGRTHQIRAHLAFAGYPLLGEGKYGENRADRKLGYAHQALCAYSLRFAFDPNAEPTVLDYLSEKTFSIPKAQISFVRELFL